MQCNFSSSSLFFTTNIFQAADLQEQVFQANQRLLGPDHLRTLQVMDKLGKSRQQQGRLAESITILTKAMDGIKSQLPNTDPATYHLLEQLGTTLRACFRF